MSLTDWIILLLAVACVAASLVAWRRRKRRGKTGCGGGCPGCPHAGGCPDKRDDESAG